MRIRSHPGADMTHLVTFSHGACAICPRCRQPIDMWQYLGEDCPASCHRGVHVWLDGADHCACGEQSDRLLVTLLTGQGART